MIRLHHIWQTFPFIRNEAAELALRIVCSETYDIDLYKTLKRLQSASSMSMDHQDNLSDEWITKTGSTRTEKLNLILNELKIVQEHFIKESIRLGYIELGEYHIRCGNGSAAFQAFFTSREYSVLPIHVLELSYNLLKTSLYFNINLQTAFIDNWAEKAHQVYTQEKSKLNSEKSGEYMKRIYIIQGLVKLLKSTEEYGQGSEPNHGIHINTAKEVAINFERDVEISMWHFQMAIAFSFPKDTINADNILTDFDLLLLTVLCILCNVATGHNKIASMYLSDTTEYKQFQRSLSSYSNLLQLLRSYSDGNLKKVLKTSLHFIQDYAVWDVYLSKIVPVLLKKIEQNCVLLLASVYTSVNITDLMDYLYEDHQTKNKISPEALTKMLETLIDMGKLDARIDYVDQRLVKNTQPQLVDGIQALRAAECTNSSIQTLVDRSKMTRKLLFMEEQP